MKYLCLIYDEEKAFAAMSKREIDGLMAEYRAFSESIQKSGHYIAGHQLSRRFAPHQPCGCAAAGCRRPTARLRRRRSSLAGIT